MPHTLTVGSYSGLISTISFNPEAKTLKVVSTTDSSAPAPCWQHYDKASKLLYCANEVPEGVIHVYKVLDGGALEKVAGAPAANGPVSLDMAGKGLLASASYGGSAINTYTTTPSGSIQPLQTLHLTLPPDHSSLPGVNPGRQEASHPHQALFDPTGNFLLIPDLGADYVRIFPVTYHPSSTPTIQETEPLVVTPSWGPRHGSFNHKGDKFYLVHELACMLEAFDVSYEENKIVFKKWKSLSMLGKGDKPTDSNVDRKAGAEICVSHDDKHIYASNRFDKSFTSETDGKQHDTIAHFTVSADGQGLDFVSLYSCGGENPRNFILSPDDGGKYLITVTQDTHRLCVFERDVESGAIVKTPLATLEGLEKGVCVTWIG